MIKNDHLMAYREGRLDDIPPELFEAVIERESQNEAPKPSPEAIEAHRRKLAGEAAPVKEADADE